VLLATWYIRSVVGDKYSASCSVVGDGQHELQVVKTWSKRLHVGGEMNGDAMTELCRWSFAKFNIEVEEVQTFSTTAHTVKVRVSSFNLTLLRSLSKVSYRYENPVLER